MSSYFSTFPKVLYFDRVATNLTLRAAFIDRLKQLSSVYYPYEVRDGDTADVIASKYYGDSSFDWLVYMANDIIDPYTQWPKTYAQFEDYIVKKYGSREAAQSEILFYRRYPTVGYISVDGEDFTTSIPADTSSYNETMDYTDVRVTPETYSNMGPEIIQYYPVYAYDYELEENDKKRHIVLIDDTLAYKIFSELKDLMNG